LLDQDSKARRESVAGLRVFLARAAEGFAKALIGDGLEEIVESVHLEGAEGVPIVRGDEHELGHIGRSRGGDALYNVEAVDAGHLHVQKDEIRVVLLDRGDGGFAAVRFSDDLHAGLGAQQAQDFATRRGFVIDDENLE
jgi:hypothetical protein